MAFVRAKAPSPLRSAGAVQKAARCSMTFGRRGSVWIAAVLVLLY